jgi:hypothetical protein
MKVQKFTFTTVQLDAGTDIDTKLVVNGVNYYPTGVRIKNKSGVPQELIFLTGDTEEADYAINPGHYVAFPIDNNETYYNDRKMYRVSKFIIKTVTGYNATDPVDVLFMGYRSGGIV